MTAHPARRPDSVETTEIQQVIVATRLRKSLNTTDVPLEFRLLNGEIAEAFEAWQRGEATAGDELADVTIYLLGSRRSSGADFCAEVESQEERRAFLHAQLGRCVCGASTRLGLSGSTLAFPQPPSVPERPSTTHQR
jgi:NTP pyrophosphatase (non-canonical NTP hydrolase)